MHRFTYGAQKQPVLFSLNSLNTGDILNFARHRLWIKPVFEELARSENVPADPDSESLTMMATKTETEGASGARYL